MFIYHLSSIFAMLLKTFRTNNQSDHFFPHFRTCYNANPRPDALMKEQLVEMTGLSPRVIRVWFQNKRCKDKKKTIQMKLQMQQEKVIEPLAILIEILLTDPSLIH